MGLDVASWPSPRGCRPTRGEGRLWTALYKMLVRVVCPSVFWQWAHARPGVAAGSLATAPQRQAATDSVPPIYEISRRVRGGQAPTDSAEMILSIYAWEEARGRRSLPLSCRLPCFPSSPCTCRNACNWPAKWRGGLRHPNLATQRQRIHWGWEARRRSVVSLPAPVEPPPAWQLGGGPTAMVRGGFWMARCMHLPHKPVPRAVSPRYAPPDRQR